MARISPSKDVKFSFERYADKASTNKDKAFFASIDSIDASDPAKLTLTFKEPSFSALLHLGYNTAIVLDEKSAADESNHPIGTGPYKLGSWSKGSALTLDAWDGFRDASKIAIKHATFKFISDSAAQAAAVLSGDVESFPRIDPAVLDQFKTDARFKVMLGGTEGKTILAINNRKPPLSDLKVRQAIAYALDRKAIMDGAANGLGAPIGSHMTPNDPGYVDLTGQYPHDAAKAKSAVAGGRRQDPASAHLDAAAAGLRPSGRAGHRHRTGGGRHRGQDRKRRMGAMALQRLHQP